MKYRPAPNIRVVDIVIPDQKPALKLTFPLKCYVTMQNNSTECADVRVRLIPLSQVHQHIAVAGEI